MDTQTIIDLYANEQLTLREIALKLNTNHKLIGRILKREGIEIAKRNKLRVFTEEHKRKISESSKGRLGIWKGKKMPVSSLVKNMKAHLSYDVSLEWLSKFEDIEKLKALNRSITRSRERVGWTSETYIKFIERFYNDKQFNKVYQRWIEGGKNKWLTPSLDHINPKSNGCDLTELDNLHFLTWLENRCKSDIQQEEWNNIKKNIHNYFI